MGSTYVAPRFNFEETLEEYQHIITQKQFFICGGDFNAKYTLWGYTEDSTRGD